jgi:hypothetical protein
VGLNMVKDIFFLLGGHMLNQEEGRVFTPLKSK